MTEQLRWHEREESLLPTTAAGAIQVIDSWLVVDGQMRGLRAHTQRFLNGCGASVAGRPRVVAFLRAAIARLPTTGRWFPRLELALLDGEPRLALLIRPAPPLGAGVRLHVVAGPDQRRRPGVKGSDLDHLTSLREQARIAGADEALILDDAGHVLEGSSTSLLWWRADVLCGPPTTSRLLPSVTRQLLFAVAGSLDVRTRVETPTPRELDGVETWAVNALHGIRPVTSWTNAPVNPGPAVRADVWRARLDLLAEPIDAL